MTIEKRILESGYTKIQCPECNTVGHYRRDFTARGFLERLDLIATPHRYRCLQCGCLWEEIKI